MQNMPVVLALSQSADPQRQLPSFADVPSAMLHDATVGREQVLDAAVQTRPVPVPRPLLVQSLLPHAQSDGLAAEPSDIEQTAGGLLLQVLVAETQYMPVVSLPAHATFPQMQGAALLGADPSVFVQAGAVRVHMHVRVVVQDVVEEVLVLKYR